MPPASAVNNNNAAVQAAAAERAERLRGSLRGFILADRQRKQEDYDRQCEEYRLQKIEQEKERVNNLALEDTREQISRLDEQLAELHQKKEQLVVQLKKVLNDDETRKKQAKENEMYALQQAQIMHNSVTTPQVFLPPVRLPHHQLSLLQKAPPGNQSTSVKRGRSPSPPSQQTTFYKTGAGYTQQQKSSAQYPSTGTLFYQTTAAPPTTQSIYNYTLPLRPAYHVELQAGPTATVSKAPGSQSPSSKAQPMQVLHINLDQPPTQADLVQVSTVGATSSLTVQTSKPQVTMEKLPDRYHIEVKHDGPTVPAPPHLLTEGVIFKPLLGELSLHPNVLQISTSATPNAKTTGSITQGFAAGRATTGYDQQVTRQQLSLPSASTASAQPTQQLQYTRRLY